MINRSRERANFEYDLADHLIERDIRGQYVNTGVRLSWEKHLLQVQITELQQKLAKYENPDYVLVPREPTDEVCEIIALSAKVCGGIALDIYTAMIEEVEKSNG